MHNNFINRYHFSVDWGGNRIDFLEINGLNVEIEAIHVRKGSSPEEVETKIPGLLKYSEVSFKRTIEKGDNQFFEWIQSKAFGAVERRDIVIKLLNENHESVIVWMLRNCFPTKYIGPTLISNNSELATETLVIVHEGMRIESMGKG